MFFPHYLICDATSLVILVAMETTTAVTQSSPKIHKTKEGSSTSTSAHSDKHSKKSRETEEYDVVVVGAGLAGLSTAYRMASLGKKVLLCDAYEIGGRTKSIDWGSDKVSVGGVLTCLFVL